MMVYVTPNADKSTTPSRGPRVHFLSDPVRKESGFDTLGWLLFFFGGLPIVGWCERYIRIHKGFPVPISQFPIYAMLLLLLLAYRGPLIGSLPRRRQAANSDRRRRLIWLIERRDFVERFPHRLIEWRHYRFREKSLDIKASASKLRPGEVILLYFPRDETARYAERSGLVFEPIPLRVNESRVKWLCATPEARGAGIVSIIPLRQRIWREFSRRRRVPFDAVICAVIVIQAWVDTYWIKASLLAVVLAVNFLPMLIVGRQYFLVPGGLVRLENGLRFRTPRIELLTPRNSSLVLYADGGAFVATRGKATFIPTNETMIRALIRAWLSTARTPTMSELRTLLAPEGSSSSQTANPV